MFNDLIHWFMINESSDFAYLIQRIFLI